MKIINSKSYQKTCMHTLPYQWGLIKNGIHTDYVKQLFKEFPNDKFTVVSAGRADKSYQMLARPVLAIGAQEFDDINDFTPVWQDFMAEVFRKSYRHMLANVVNLDLKE